MHNLKALALANPDNLDILKSIIKTNLIQATQKNVESRRLSCCAGSVREKIEMSEQQLVSADEVNASPLEGQPMAEQAVLSEENAIAQQPASPQTHSAADEGGPVVKLLSVGQELKGTVKRITEFGAFVDIGVGRDGLIHISELSTTRVAKVTDVLQEGQPITLWIKKLDRDRNRISLTMIEPGKRTIRDLQVGEIVQGTVTRLLPYGAFIDIGVGRDALLHVREMSNSFVAKPEDVVNIGDNVEVRILEVARRRNRIDLSMKGLRPEPEVQLPEPVVREEVVDVHEPETAAEDRFDEIEALTTMQMAFRKAQERSGVDIPMGKNKNQRRTQAAHKRAAQDDIIERTLGGQTNRK